MTRAMQRLILIQSWDHRLGNLRKRLLKPLEGIYQTSATLKKRDADWLAEALMQMRVGNESSAREIYDAYLSKDQKQRYDELSQQHIVSAALVRPPVENSVTLAQVQSVGCPLSQSVVAQHRVEATVISKLLTPFEQLKSDFTLTNFKAFLETSDGKRAIYSISSLTGKEWIKTAPVVTKKKVKTKVNAVHSANCSLLEYILSDPNRSAVYIKYIKQQKEKVLVKNYVRLLDQLIIDGILPEAIELSLLKAVFCLEAKDSDFVFRRLAYYLSANALCLSDASPMYWIMNKSQHVDLFKEFLTRDASMLYSLPDAIWERPLSNEQDADYGCTPLWLLSATKSSFDFLDYLLTYHRGYFFASISGKAWSFVYSGKDQLKLGVSPIYWLTKSLSGHNFLQVLSRCNPDWFGVDVCKALKFPRSDVANDTPLTSIVEHMEFASDNKILILLLAARPALFDENFMKKILMVESSNINGSQANTSLLYYLSMHNIGREFLMALITLRSELFSPQFMHVFQLVGLSADVGTNCKASALYWMAKDIQGSTFLNRLLLLKSELFNHDFISALILPRPASLRSEGNVSAFYWLCASKEGRTFINRLFSLKPELFGSNVMRAMILARNDLAGKEAFYTPLYCLVKTADGIEILNLLHKMNPELFDADFMHALIFIPTNSPNVEFNFTALYWLSSNISGRQFLTRLLMENEQLLDLISAETWLKSRKDLSQFYNNTSALCYLLAYVDGHALLSQILKKYPTILKDIKEDEWMHSYPVNDDDTINRRLVVWGLIRGQHLVPDMAVMVQLIEEWGAGPGLSNLIRLIKQKIKNQEENDNIKRMLRHRGRFLCCTSQLGVISENSSGVAQSDMYDHRFI